VIAMISPLWMMVPVKQPNPAAASLLIVTAMLWIAGPAFGGTPEDPAQLAAAVRHAALAIAPPDSNIVLGPISGAQVMQACRGPLGVSLSGQAPYEQAAVHCQNPAWVLYLSVNVAQNQMVEVSAGPIAAGQTIRPDNVKLAEEPVSLFAGRQVYYDSSQLIGADTTMCLQKGAIISSDDVSEPVMVAAGQTVAVQVISGGVQVSVDAVANQTGRIGDTILFTNPSSGRRFSALITGNGPIVKLQF